MIALYVFLPGDSRKSNKQNPDFLLRKTLFLLTGKKIALNSLDATWLLSNST